MIIVAPVQAESGCGFGFSFDYPEYVAKDDGYYLPDGTKIPNLLDWMDENEFCAPTKWSLDKRSDGFSKSISISMSPDNEDPNTDGYSSIEIFCTKKKIYVYVWVEYADSFGWNGTGQVRFDNGPVKSVAYYLQKDFDGVVLKDSKTFMSNLLKTKKKFAFKIPHVDGYDRLVYPKGNIAEFRQTFSKAGCKY